MSSPGKIRDVIRRYRLMDSLALKNAAIEERQIRRAIVIVNWAAPIIHKGKKP